MPNRRFHLQLIAAILALNSALGAQDTTAFPRATVVITARGFVFDSIAGRPISGANVQFAGADSQTAGKRYAAQSDSTGRFAIPDVVPGHYLAGFFDPALDTLGIESNGQPTDIEGANQTIVLAVPSARTLGVAFCGVAMASSPSFTLLYGKVRDAETDSDALGGSVSIGWADARQDSGHLTLVDRNTSVSVRQGGTFAACGLPSDQALTIRAGRGADSSGTLILRLPKGGLRHLILGVAPAGGKARLIGRVVDEGHVPVSGARATFNSGQSVREAVADVSGTFRLDSLPVGTQTLQVRAIGHAPQSVIVQLASNRENATEVVLQRVTVLPGVMTTAEITRRQEFIHDKNVNPFDAFFVEPPHPLDYPPMLTICQILQTVPRIGTCAGPYNLRPGYCSNANGFILNGKPVLLPFEAVQPQDILGVESYPPPPGRLKQIRMPSQYEGVVKSMGLCPVVVWTK